jgi:hypothetical protein
MSAQGSAMPEQAEQGAERVEQEEMTAVIRPARHGESDSPLTSAAGENQSIKRF